MTIQPQQKEFEVKYPNKLAFLINESARYKVLYGGRGGMKTETIAMALIILASQNRLRVACFREFQKSINESVHATIKAKIYDMGLDNEFLIKDTSIVSKRTGAEFIFFGLRYNIDSIKSLSRIDIAWVEEAKNVSKASWNILGPTIRGRPKDDPNGQGGPFGKGPEIWVSFNPELDTDETYKRFILKPPSEFNSEVTSDDVIWFKKVQELIKSGNISLKDRDKEKYDFIADNRYSIIQKLSYRDNPWFPADLRAEMEACRARSEDEYLEVWEGYTKQVLDGAIYAEEIRKTIKDNRLGKVPYDESRPVHTFWDLGRNDHTSIWFIQTVGMEFNVINYYENRLKKMPWYIGILQEMGYVYGVHNLPHDGAAETLSNITPERQLRNMNIGKVRIIKAPLRKSIGINAARTVFDLCNFDETNTIDGFNCLRRYCYAVDENTGGFSKEPKHDEYSNGADGFQTFALSLKPETAQKKLIGTVASNSRTLGALRSGSSSWMG